MKIYTRTGDAGTTALIGGQRVSKGDKRLDVFGTVDELNAALGLSVCAAVGPQAELARLLAPVQHELFVLGSHLATPEGSGLDAGLPPLDDQMVARLEMEIDAAEALLPPLRQFILPGGSELAARLHVARCVCRRAERLLSDFALDRPIPALVLEYVNRLSDWLFVQARRANQLAGVADVPWRK